MPGVRPVRFVATVSRSKPLIGTVRPQSPDDFGGLVWVVEASGALVPAVEVLRNPLALCGFGLIPRIACSWQVPESVREVGAEFVKSYHVSTINCEFLNQA